LDEAIYAFGQWIEGKLDESDHKPSKDERKAKEARKRTMDKILGTTKGSGFADPALMFK